MRVPAAPPALQQLLARLDDHGRIEEVQASVPDATHAEQYLHWDQLRHRKPPAALSRDEWWAGIKLQRAPLYRVLPLTAADGSPFQLAVSPPVDEALRRIDALAKGPEAVTRRRLQADARMNARMEEAVHSAWMEGAVLPRHEAKDMLVSGRAPFTNDEARVQDTYEGLLVLDELLREPMTPDVLLELHYVMTSRTLGTAGAGRLRGPLEVPRVYTLRGLPVLTPPNAKELQQRVGELCDFANGATPDWWVHPVLRAAIVHLWVCYEHPFVDGNGLIARALAQWMLLRSGYPLASYLLLSRVLRADPARAERALLYTTTDENDATYVVVGFLQALLEAIDALEAWQWRANEADRRLAGQLGEQVNDRQRRALGFSSRHHTGLTIRDYAERFDVSEATAGRDLKDLVDLGLMARERIDRHLEFRATGSLPGV